MYENKGMVFKGGIPVTRETIEERIGVRTRRVAPVDERIGVIAFQDLLDTSGIDPARIRVLIAATNVGEDKYDPGPTSAFTFMTASGNFARRRWCSTSMLAAPAST